ncbi:MAG TPA: chemotaxis protein CheC [Gemmatimonadaceae bacterium]|nr:chemotaxis protein CheC [Gemmatimonadaceae bacterium]
MSTARLDALREVANIGAGHAATALSTLTGTRIMISVPMVNVVPPGDWVPELAPDVEVVAVQMAMSGSISGRTIFLLAIPAGLRLAERMLRRARGTSPSLGKLEQSALNEAGNILAGAYLTALSEFLGMRLMLSPPSLATGDTAQALDAFGDRHPRAESPILCVETEFYLEEPAESLHGFFLLVPDPDAFDAIFRAVRVE